ncbi:MAG: cupin domain-containing protein [Promethearchaeota archaeon]
MPYTKLENLEWEPHPYLKGVEIKPLLTRKKDQADVTCYLVSVPKGGGIAEHVHENSDDIIYLLKGKGKMFIEGEGEFELLPGIFVRVPKNTKHRVYDIEEDLLIYDVFVPPIL